MNSNRPLARDVVDVVAEHLGLQTKFVRQVSAALKAQDRVAHARPVAPPPSARDLARIVLACASHSIRDAVKVGRQLGDLRLVAGDGQPHVERELIDMIEEAAGLRNGNTNFRDGDIVVRDVDYVAMNGCLFREGAKDASGLTRVVVIRNRAIAQIARLLLEIDDA